MTQEIKDEALEELELNIKFGFENEEQLFDRIRDMFYDEDDFDEEWLRNIISERYNTHQAESRSWACPTNFERLAESFDELIKQKIVCLHNAGYTKQDGESDCIETIEELHKLGIKAVGYCYYHSQDLGRAVDLESRNLFLGFDSATRNNNEAIEVAGKIITTLKKNGFQTHWAGTVDERIEIQNINWQKVPDNEEWGGERVIRLLSKPKSDKKPFWKFW